MRFVTRKIADIRMESPDFHMHDMLYCLLGVMVANGVAMIKKVMLLMALVISLATVEIVKGHQERSLEEWCLSEGQNWSNDTCYVAYAELSEGEGTIIIGNGEHMIVNRMRNGDHILIHEGGQLTILFKFDNFNIYIPCIDPGCMPEVQEGQIDNYGQIYNKGLIDNDYWTGWYFFLGEGVINNMESGLLFNYGSIECGEVYPDEFRINNYGVVYYPACSTNNISCETGGTGIVLELDGFCHYLPRLLRN